MQKEKRATEDEMVGWYHWFKHIGLVFEQTPGYSGWQGSLACCSSWSSKEFMWFSDWTTTTTTTRNINCESFLKVIDIKTNTKSHQKARKLQYQMPYTKPLAKEEHNVTSWQKVCIKPCQSHRPPKLITGQHNDLQRDKILIHPPEHRHKSPNQETFTRPWSNPTHRGQIPQIRGTMTFRPAKEDLKHSKLNKLKRQRNLQQTKEHGRNA